MFEMCFQDTNIFFNKQVYLYCSNYLKIKNMSRQDVEHFQSFCRRWINKAVRKHFKDVDDNDEASLRTDSPRGVIRTVCLHKDTDPMTLTLGRLLIWWVEAKGLIDEYIYGIPSTDFEISNTYYPQVKLHFREDKYQAADSSRKPVRGEVSFRWLETDYSTLKINALINRIYNNFCVPVFFYNRGREHYTYVDKSKGYYFQMTVKTEDDAKKVITQVIDTQDSGTPDWTNCLRKHDDNKSYTTTEYVKVMGENKKKPKKRPIAKVEFVYAELFIPGTTKPIVLIDRTGKKHNALRHV